MLLRLAPLHLLLLLTITGTACGSGEEVAQSTETEAATRAVDTQADAQEIRRLSGEYLRAVMAKDVAAASSFFAEDAISVYSPGAGVTRGRDAIRQGFERSFSARPASFETSWEPSEIKFSRGGDVAYELGTWEESREGQRARGRYLGVWEKIGGEWKIVRSIGGSHPAPGGETVVQ